MTRILTIDIETLPALELAPAVSSDERAVHPYEDYLKTALNGDFGRILCIGFVDEGPNNRIEDGVLGWDEHRSRFIDDERSILIQFWERMRDFRPSRDRIVGHNIFDFDLKFIFKRSIVHGIRPAAGLSFARYRNQPIYDTMMEWERWSYGLKVSLDKLARVLELPSSKADGVDGSKVFDLYQAGQYRAIRDYCMKDVWLTRSIYRRMEFLESMPERQSTQIGSIGLSASASA